MLYADFSVFLNPSFFTSYVFNNAQCGLQSTATHLTTCSATVAIYLIQYPVKFKFHFFISFSGYDQLATVRWNQDGTPNFSRLPKMHGIGQETDT